MKYQGILVLTLLGLSQVALATNTDSYEITISNHQFEPAEVIIPANTKVRLVVHNQDNSPEEFESHSLHREKIIGPNQSGVINLGPLPAGVYEFVGEFHEDTARGRIVVQ